MEKEIVYYQTRKGREPFTEWIKALKDKVVRYRIWSRVWRIGQGDYGDHKRFCGIIELRLGFGKGYRIYCAEKDNDIVVLLVGGDKSSQDNDIKLAQEYWRDYNEENKI